MRPPTASVTTLTPAIAGTLPYMAPEVLRGERPDATERHLVTRRGAARDGQRRPAVYGEQSGYALTAAILEAPIPPLPDHVAPAVANGRCSAVSFASLADAARTPARSVQCSRRVARWILASGRQAIDRVCPAVGRRPWRLVGAGGAAIAAAVVNRGRISSLLRRSRRGGRFNRWRCCRWRTSRGMSSRTTSLTA